MKLLPKRVKKLKEYRFSPMSVLLVVIVSGLVGLGASQAVSIYNTKQVSVPKQTPPVKTVISNPVTPTPAATVPATAVAPPVSTKPAAPAVSQPKPIDCSMLNADATKALQNGDAVSYQIYQTAKSGFLNPPSPDAQSYVDQAYNSYLSRLTASYGDYRVTVLGSGCQPTASQTAPQPE